MSSNFGSNLLKMLKNMDINKILDKYSVYFPIREILIATGIFGLSWIFTKYVRSRLFDYLKKTDIDESVTKTTISITNLVIYCLAIIINFYVLKLPMAPVLAVMGTIGVGLGFALSDVMKNMFGGVLLLYNKHITSGDYVKIYHTSGGNYSNGVILSINLLNTILYDYTKDEIKHVPNIVTLGSAIERENTKGVNKFKLEKTISRNNHNDDNNNDQNEEEHMQKIEHIKGKIDKLLSKLPKDQLIFYQISENSSRDKILVNYWVLKSSSLNDQIVESFEKHGFTCINGINTQQNISAQTNNVIEKNSAKRVSITMATLKKNL